MTSHDKVGEKNSVVSLGAYSLLLQKELGQFKTLKNMIKIEKSEVNKKNFIHRTSLCFYKIEGYFQRLS